MRRLSWRFTPTTVNMNEVVKSSTTMGIGLDTYIGYRGDNMYKIVDAYLRIMEETVLRGYEFNIPKFGKFRVQRSPNTKAHITRVNNLGKVIQARHNPFFVNLVCDSPKIERAHMTIKAGPRIKREMIIAESQEVKFAQKP